MEIRPSVFCKLIFQLPTYHLASSKHYPWSLEKLVLQMILRYVSCLACRMKTFQHLEGIKVQTSKH
jgi:hypothetical protein